MTLELCASGALFDMDGTLVDSTAVVERLWGEFAAEHAIDPSELLAFSHGRSTTDVVRQFLPFAPAAVRDELIARLERRELLELDGIVAVPGAIALLRGLSLPWAVVTSAPRELAVRRLTTAGVRVPDVLITADDVQSGKPSPEGYLRAAELLGVPIGECVLFEDAPAGIEAGRASGARTIVVGDLPGVSTRGPRVPDLREVRLRLPAD